MHHVTAQKLIVSLRRFLQVDLDVRMKVLPFRPHRHDDALSVILWVLPVPGVVEVPMAQGQPLRPFGEHGQYPCLLGLVLGIVHIIAPLALISACARLAGSSACISKRSGISAWMAGQSGPTPCHGGAEPSSNTGGNCA